MHLTLRNHAILIVLHFINKYYEDYATATDRKDGMIRVSGVHWFTNLEIKKRHEDLILYKKYKGPLNKFS